MYTRLKPSHTRYTIVTANMYNMHALHVYATHNLHVWYVSSSIYDTDWLQTCHRHTSTLSPNILEAENTEALTTPTWNDTRVLAGSRYSDCTCTILSEMFTRHLYYNGTCFANTGCTIDADKLIFHHATSSTSVRTVMVWTSRALVPLSHAARCSSASSW